MEANNIDIDIDNDLANNCRLTQKEKMQITLARRRIEEANKTAFIKYRMFTVDEFREILHHREWWYRYENNVLGWQDQPADRPNPLWLKYVLLDWKFPLIYPSNLFD
jgi:hypothetical protein